MATAGASTAIFQWTDAYSVGISQIDAQHKGLVRLINDLHTAMSMGKGRQVLGKILNDLVYYTKSHFAFEESLLQQHQYSNLASHQITHAKLTQQVLELQERFVSSEVALTVEVMQFLRSWLANHILVDDHAYALELKAEVTR